MAEVTVMAEVKSVAQRKTQSLDNEYKMTIATDDPNLLEVGKLPPDKMVRVKVSWSDKPT